MSLSNWPELAAHVSEAIDSQGKLITRVTLGQSDAGSLRREDTENSMAADLTLEHLDLPLQERHSQIVA